MTQEPNEKKPDRIVKMYDRPAGADKRSPVGLIVAVVVALIALALVLHFGLHRI